MLVACVALACSEPRSAPAGPPTASSAPPPDANAATPPDAEPVAPTLEPPWPELPWSTLPALPRRLRVRDWGEARATWRTATTAYARRAPGEAAEHFFAVARVLFGPAKPRYRRGRVRRSARCLAYDNAGVALGAAGDLEDAVRRLREAGEEDAGCEHTIERRIARLTLTATLTGG